MGAPQSLLPTCDEQRSDLLVTPTEIMICLNKGKKEATKRNVIHTENRVTIGGSTLNIVRGYDHIRGGHLEEQCGSIAASQRSGGAGAAEVGLSWLRPSFPAWPPMPRPHTSSL